MGFATQPLTWLCMVCRTVRFDADIAVHTSIRWMDSGELSAAMQVARALYSDSVPMGTRIALAVNVRYCRDKDSCKRGAPSAIELSDGVHVLPPYIEAAFPDLEAQKDFVEKVPPHMWDGVAMYVGGGVPNGSYLTAVFRGDLFEAALHADALNSERLVELCRFIGWHAPTACYGSPEKVTLWMETQRQRAERAGT